MLKKKLDIAAIFAASACGAAGFIAFVNSVRNDFTFDDEILILQNPAIRKLSNIPEIILHGYRPVREISYALDYALGGTSPFMYHLSNLAFHAASAVIAFLVARRLLGSLSAAAVTGLVFAMHPVQTDSVTYISGRRDLLFGFFYLAGFLSYMSFRQSGRYSRLAATFACFILSILSKEMAASFPLALLLYDFACASPASGLRGEMSNLLLTLRRNFAVYVTFAAATLLFAFRYVFVQEASHAIEGTSISWWGGSFGLNVLTSFKVLGHYVFILLFPGRLIADYYGFEPARCWHDPAALLSLLAVAALVAAAVRWLRRERLTAAFSVLWFLATLTPVMQIPPHHELLALHYLYIPLLGFALLTGAAFRALVGSDVRPLRLSAAALAAVAVFSYGARTVARNGDWRNSLTLTASSVRDFPASARSITSMCIRLAEMNLTGYGLMWCRLALLRDPRYAPVYNNVGAMLEKLGREDDALFLYSTGWNLKRSGNFLLNLGNLLLKRGDTTGAEAALRQALRVHPDFVLAYAALGNLLAAESRQEEAEAMLREGLLLMPDYPEFHFLLGQLALSNLDFEKAAVQYRAAIAMDRGHLHATENLDLAERLLDLARLEPDPPELVRGQARLVLGMNEDAEQDFATALEKDPFDETAQQGRGMALMRMGRFQEASSFLCGGRSNSFEACGRCLAGMLDFEGAAAAIEKGGPGPAASLVEKYREGARLVEALKNPPRGGTAGAGEMLLMGKIYASAGLDDLAGQTFLHASKDGLHFEEALLAIAQLRLGGGKVPGAMEIYKEVLDRIPGSAGALLGLGNLYLEKGIDVIGAKSCYESYIAIAGQDGKEADEVRRRLARIDAFLEKIQVEGRYVSPEKFFHLPLGPVRK